MGSSPPARCGWRKSQILSPLVLDSMIKCLCTHLYIHTASASSLSSISSFLRIPQICSGRTQTLERNGRRHTQRVCQEQRKVCGAEQKNRRCGRPDRPRKGADRSSACESDQTERDDDGRGTSLRIPRGRSRSLALRLTLYVPTSTRRLIKKCKKPDKTEFLKVARLTAVGFLAVGCLGFFVKLIFIPINQIIVSSQS